MEQDNSRNKTTIMSEAKSGDADAQHAIGLLYLTSWRCDDDSLSLAQKWLECAAEQGHEGAGFALQNIEAQEYPSLTSGME